MLHPNNDLSENDIKLLSYIDKFDHVTTEQVVREFQGRIHEVEFRLSVLSHKEKADSPSYIEEEFVYETNSYGFLEHRFTNKLHITPLGRTALQNHRQQTKVKLKAMVIHEIYIPIVVSVITACLTTLAIYLLKPTLPLMLQLLSSTSK